MTKAALNISRAIDQNLSQCSEGDILPLIERLFDEATTSEQKIIIQTLKDKDESL